MRVQPRRTGTPQLSNTARLALSRARRNLDYVRMLTADVAAMSVPQLVSPPVPANDDPLQSSADRAEPMPAMQNADTTGETSPANQFAGLQQILNAIDDDLRLLADELG